ncbi:hypothetical protein A2V82_07195 [candidate division KSB1 bacterium RBG_16_48_16]|nr:MAG: hypothetical protein A2V82_07195 [candidate division KSB1 bacterium RBG_16_48_16]
MLVACPYSQAVADSAEAEKISILSPQGGEGQGEEGINSSTKSFHSLQQPPNALNHPRSKSDFFTLTLALSLEGEETTGAT